MDHETHMQFLASEGFIRRTTQSNFPIMLKGSYLTRQYMRDPNMRLVNDLDWVFLDPVNDHMEFHRLLARWLYSISITNLYDGVLFTPYNMERVWDRIDYAMNDDFPTISTWLFGKVNGEEIYPIQIDVSYNLPVEPDPVPLIYRPWEGEPLHLSYTCPLSLQVAWKLHQTIVRPRFKDIYDLIHLLEHPDFDAKSLQDCLDALRKECRKDRVPTQRLIPYLDGSEFLRLVEAERELNDDNWPKFNQKDKLHPAFPGYLHAQICPDYKLPRTMSGVVQLFEQKLRSAGFTPELLQ